MSTTVITEHRWRTTLALTLRDTGRAPDTRRTVVAERILLEQIGRLEVAASRFRPDSEISDVNRSAGSWVPVSELLVELVSVALAAADSTAGLVNPCVGHQVDAVGYRTWAAAEVSLVDPVVPAPATPGAWRDVDVAPGRVRIPVGTALDLGATAKGWLADEVAERVADETGLDVVANMGGDLRAIAHGPGWTVTADHEVPGLSPRSVEIADAGMATSGQGRRRWLTTQGPAHHLIDPRTGRSATTCWWAVSALSASATTANVAATAGMLLGSAAPQWFDDRDLDGLFSAWSGAGQPRSVTVGRWPRMGAAA